MSFRKPQTIKRVASGSYVNGDWVNGAASSLTIQASVQPMSMEDMKDAPEGRRMSDMVKMYTDSDLFTVEDSGENQQPDKLTWRGRDYEIISKGVHQMSVVSHYKYICAVTSSQG